MPGAQRIGKVRERQRLASGCCTQIRGDTEQPRDTEADLGLLLGGQDSSELAVNEGGGVIAAVCRVQPHRSLRYKGNSVADALGR